jgi:hypothetical protein
MIVIVLFLVPVYTLSAELGYMRISLIEGDVQIKKPDAGDRGYIQVDPPDSSTRAFDKAIFRIDLSEQYTDVAVYKGYVETKNNVVNTRKRSAGQMVSLGQNTDGELAPGERYEEACRA